jgi:hypothetical protein
LQIKTKIVSCHTADSKPVKQEVNGTVILPPLVFPGQAMTDTGERRKIERERERERREKENQKIRKKNGKSKRLQKKEI